MRNPDSVKELLRINDYTIKSAETTKRYRKFFRAAETYFWIGADPANWVSPLERSRTRAINRLVWQDKPTESDIELVVKLELAPLQ